MSVPKSRRNLSDVEFFRNANLLRKEMTLLLMRDFGIKDKVRKVASVANKMNEEDSEVFVNLMNKYECTYILDEYPEWMVDKLRTNIMNILHKLIMNITQANSIYVTTEPEYHLRRQYQDLAIGNCEQLYQEMQYIMSIIPIDSNKLMRYVKMIDDEIALLKGWRKSDNKVLRKLQNKDNKQ